MSDKATLQGGGIVEAPVSIFFQLCITLLRQIRLEFFFRLWVCTCVRKGNIQYSHAHEIVRRFVYYIVGKSNECAANEGNCSHSITFFQFLIKI